MKLKMIALAALAVVSAPSFAAIDTAASGNGELVAVFRFYNGAGTTAVGGEDRSATFDLGVSMDSFLANKNVAGFSKTWTLSAANYGTAWDSLKTFAGSSVNNIQYGVVAFDSLGTQAGERRILSTNSLNTAPTQNNGNISNVLNATSGATKWITATNLAGTHTTEANGANFATNNDGNAYFGNMGGAAGDTLATNWNTFTKAVTVSQNFYSYANSSTSATGTALTSVFGFDVDGNGSIAAAEYGKWSVDVAKNTITFANPAAPVPEPETYAMLLAGLGLMGAIVRRRQKRA